MVAAAIVVLFVRPARGAVWAGPLGVAAVGLVVGAVPVAVAQDALGVLRDPLLFLVMAVPLAATLDSIGVFEALAALVSGGRHLALGLWVLAALVTIVLNLDAAVVLLTALYIRYAIAGVARRGPGLPTGIARMPRSRPRWRTRIRCGLSSSRSMLRPRSCSPGRCRACCGETRQPAAAWRSSLRRFTSVGLRVAGPAFLAGRRCSIFTP